MTAGARAGLMRLYQDFKDRVQFVSIYVREAHPGENYPHHTSMEQKREHARDWVEQDDVPWTVAIDHVDGRVHRRLGGLPNAVYLVDRSGHVAFRALWAGQESLLRKNLEALLEAQERGVDRVVLGEKKNMLIPMLRGAVEFDYSLGRGGEKSKQDFRREMGGLLYGVQELASKARPLVHDGASPAT